MSRSKYSSILSPQMEAIVFIVLQIFFAMRVVLKIGECSWIFPSFSRIIISVYTNCVPVKIFERLLITE